MFAKTRNIEFHENSFSISRVVAFRWTERKKKSKNIIYLVFFPELTQSVAQCTYIAADCCSQTDTLSIMFSVSLHSTYTVQILYKLYSLQLISTYSNYTEAAATCSAA